MSTYTNPSKGLQWESGAGRVHSSHKLTLKYAKDYGITLFPIPSDTVWRSKDGESKDLWPSLSLILTSFLSRLRPAVLATHTIYQLLEKIYGTSEAERVLAYFPYSAEVRVMRADLAIQSIQREMGSNSNFFVAKKLRRKFCRHSSSAESSSVYSRRRVEVDGEAIEHGEGFGKELRSGCVSFPCVQRNFQRRAVAVAC
jgi:hypothetical protein